MVVAFAVISIGLIARLVQFRFGLPDWPLEAELRSGGGFWPFLACIGLPPHLDAAKITPAAACVERRIVILRLASIALACASFVLLWLVGRGLFSAGIALLAVAFFAVYPHSVFWSRFAFRETVAGFFLLVGVLLLSRWGRGGSPMAFFGAGLLFVWASGEAAWAVLLWLGVLWAFRFSVAAKPGRADVVLLLSSFGLVALFLFDSAVPILVPISLMIISVAGLISLAPGLSELTGRKAWWWRNALGGLLGAALGFVPRFLASGQAGFGASGFDMLYRSLGPSVFALPELPILILASFGLAFVIADSTRSDLLPLGYLVISLVLGAGTGVVSDLGPLRAAPIICLFAAVGAARFSGLLAEALGLSRAKKLLTGLIASFVLVAASWQSTTSLLQLFKRPTLAAAADWAEKNIPPGSKIAVERGAGALCPERFKITYLQSAGDLSPAEYQRRGFRFVIIGKWNIDKAQSAAATDISRLVNYAGLARLAGEAWGFGPTKELAGPEVYIVRIRRRPQVLR